MYNINFIYLFLVVLVSKFFSYDLHMRKTMSWHGRASPIDVD